MRLYDLHVHTALSACAARDACIAEYCADARESGLPVIGFADHAWDKAVAGASPWYAPQDYERLLARRAEAERENGLKVLLGAEAEMAAGVVAFTPESAALLDYIICPHSHTHMKGFVLPADAEAPEKHADFLVKSFYALCVHPLARYILGVAHPMYPIGKSADEADEIYAHISDDALFFICQAAAKADLALELNISTLAPIPTERLASLGYARFFRAAKSAGCHFFLGSDRHSSKHPVHDTLARAPELAEALGLHEDDFTRALEKALAL